MRFVGGKAHVVDRLVPVLQALRSPGQLYLEPFLGGANVLPNLRGPRTGSDIHQDLMLLYIALRDGSYTPPAYVSEDEYLALRDAPPSPHRGFVGFFCSFSGAFFSGYARQYARAKTGERRDWREDTYSRSAASLLLQLRPALQGVTLRCCSYDEHTPHGCLAFCDPPYEATRRYRSTRGHGHEGFDHAAFWETMRHWSQDNTVVVSGYDAPADFPAVAAFPTVSRLRLGGDWGSGGSNTVRLEQIFAYRDAPAFARIDGVLNQGLLLVGG